MSSWTKDKAIQALEELAEKTRELESSSLGSEEFTRWHARAETTLEEMMGPESNYVEKFSNIRWSPGRLTGIFRTVRELRSQFGPAVRKARREAYLSGLEQARGILLAARDHIESKGFK